MEKQRGTVFVKSCQFKEYARVEFLRKWRRISKTRDEIRTKTVETRAKIVEMELLILRLE